MKLYLVKDKRGKYYFLKHPKQLLTIPVAQKWYPQIKGIKTAQAIQEFEKTGKAEIEV